MAYKLYAVRVFARDWTACLEFYRDVVKLPVAFDDADMGWAQFDLGGAFLGLERVGPDDDESLALVGRFVGLSIQVDDINQVYRDLSNRGVHFVGEPEKQVWGGTLAHFKDPDENVLTLLGN